MSVRLWERMVGAKKGLELVWRLRGMMGVSSSVVL